MPTSIRITLTPKIERVLKELQDERFGLLEPAEIIRAILSEYDALRHRRAVQARPTWMDDAQWRELSAWEGGLPIEEVSEKQWEEIETARKEKGVPRSRSELWKKVSSRHSA